jgi:hypothetical protein
MEIQFGSALHPKRISYLPGFLIKGRIKVRSVLFRQNIVDNENCPFGCNTRETVEHFVLECGRTKQILSLVGINLNGSVGLQSIFDAAKEECPNRKGKAWDLVTVASYWSIWFSRNQKVFDYVEVPIHLVAKTMPKLVNCGHTGPRRKRMKLSCKLFIFGFQTGQDDFPLCFYVSF